MSGLRKNAPRCESGKQQCRHYFYDPIHLGLGATAEAQAPFTDMAWYADYNARTASVGAEGRLVSLHQFTEAWEPWGTHPAGAEIVLCIARAMTLHQELVDGTTVTVTLVVGDYAINPPGDGTRPMSTGRRRPCSLQRAWGHNIARSDD